MCAPTESEFRIQAPATVRNTGSPPLRKRSKTTKTIAVPTKKRVWFGVVETKVVDETPPMSEEEKIQCWYTKKELKAIRKEVRCLLKKLQFGVLQEDESNVCLRGLEGHADKVVQANVVWNVHHVLTLQDQNRKLGRHCNHGLRYLCLNLSQDSVLANVTRGANDAMKAYCIHAETVPLKTVQQHYFCF